jgi:hypothetical protein
VAAGKMVFAASRRDLRSAIACVGSDSNGLAPPSMIAEDKGSISVRKPRDALRKLIANDRVARYLEQYQPELLIEFQKIAEMTSTLPSEACVYRKLKPGRNGDEARRVSGVNE